MLQGTLFREMLLNKLQKKREKGEIVRERERKEKREKESNIEFHSWETYNI